MNPKDLISDVRDLGPGSLMMVLGAGIVMGVLSRESIDGVSVAGSILGVVLVVIGFLYLRHTSEGKLGAIGMVGRRYLGGDQVRARLQKATQITILKTWFPEDGAIESALGVALGNGASVQLILCEPESEILKKRCEGADVEHAQARRWIIRGLKLVKKHATEDQFDGVAFFEEWPGCPVIWADERPYMGFYFRGGTSPNFPWIEIRAGSRLATILENQRDALLELAKKREKQARKQGRRGTNLLETLDDLNDWLRRNS